MKGAHQLSFIHFSVVIVSHEYHLTLLSDYRQKNNPV